MYNEMENISEKGDYISEKGGMGAFTQTAKKEPIQVINMVF